VSGFLAPRLNRLRYFCSDAWDEWRHSPAVNLLALATLSSALFVAGLVLLLIRNVEDRVATLRDDVRVEVYLTDDQAEDARQALIEELRGFEHVERVEYVDKTEALRRYHQWAAKLADLVNELESNPLPASLEVVLERREGAAEAAAGIVKHLDGRAGVEEVRFDEALLGRLEGVLQVARRGGAAFSAMVFLAVILVMASVLRLAVHARREEIEIMQLVGATPAFVRGPFLVAGVAQGLIAAGLALVVLEALRMSTLAWAARGGATALVQLVCGRGLPAASWGLVVLIGLSVSFAGSWLAVGRGAAPQAST
jgi:cell division transport system permease protein